MLNLTSGQSRRSIPSPALLAIISRYNITQSDADLAVRAAPQDQFLALLNLSADDSIPSQPQVPHRLHVRPHERLYVIDPIITCLIHHLLKPKTTRYVRSILQRGEISSI